jgi:hypothetical protein
MADSFEHGNESSGSIKCWEYFGKQKILEARGSVVTSSRKVPDSIPDEIIAFLQLT